MTNRKNISIFIVDDDPGFVLRMTRLLAVLESVESIHTAGSYEEAMVWFTHTVPDMILLDINLPGKSGISLLKKIKEKGYPSRVILISNHSESYYREKCIKLGALHFLDKTAEFERLPAIIEDLSGNSSYILS